MDRVAILALAWLATGCEPPYDGPQPVVTGTGITGFPHLYAPPTQRIDVFANVSGQPNERVSFRFDMSAGAEFGRFVDAELVPSEALEGETELDDNGVGQIAAEWRPHAFGRVVVRAQVAHGAIEDGNSAELAFPVLLDVGIRYEADRGGGLSGDTMTAVLLAFETSGRVTSLGMGAMSTTSESVRFGLYNVAPGGPTNSLPVHPTDQVLALDPVAVSTIPFEVNVDFDVAAGDQLFLVASASGPVPVAIQTGSLSYRGGWIATNVPYPDLANPFPTNRIDSISGPALYATMEPP